MHDTQIAKRNVVAYLFDKVVQVQRKRAALAIARVCEFLVSSVEFRSTYYDSTISLLSETELYLAIHSCMLSAPGGL